MNTTQQSANLNLETVMGQLAENMNQLAISNGQTNMEIKTIGQAIGVLGAEVTELKKKQYAFEATQERFAQDIDDLKNMQEIPSAHVQNIKDLANSRVRTLLGLPNNRKDYTDRNWDDYNKYYRTFISRLYSEAKRVGLCSRIDTIKKMYYPAVVEFISGWIPNDSVDGLTGIEALKRIADKKRESQDRIS